MSYQEIQSKFQCCFIIIRIMYKKSMHLFVEHYEMEEVMQEETLMRAFQRWRKLVRENKNSY